MATIDVKDASGATVPIEKPLAPGRVAAVNSRPVALSNEDKAALDGIQPVALGASVDLAFTNVSAQSAAITGSLVRLAAKGADCRVISGAGPTALATSTLIFAGVAEIVKITSGHKIAAIRDAATDGTLNITVVG